MRPLIKKIVRKYVQKSGIYIQPFPTPEHFYESLKNKPVSVRIYELTRIANYANSAENHKFYNALLKIFIPDWQINIKKAKFIGSGFSPSNLNTYRKVVAGDKLYFEKVYFNDSRSLQVVQWFQSYVYDLIKDKMKVPGIQKMYRGELLTVVYYDYFRLAALEVETEEHRLIQFSINLYIISCAYESYLKKIAPPDLIGNFKKNNHTYRRHIYIAKNKLQEEGINNESIQKSLDNSKCILTHSDIHEKNGFKNEVLIDWDFFGIYPIGVDPAMIYYRRMKHNKVKNCNSANWLREHYSTTILKEDWRDFERNFFYCLFVFAVKLFNKGLFKTIEQQLIAKLKHYSAIE
jgi:hypothetical protein